MNPMVRKELNLRMREKRGWILPTLYLVAMGATVVLAYYIVTQENFASEGLQGATVGASTFLTLSYAQLTLLLLLVPVFSAGSVTIEKEQRTLGALITSLLRPREIWFGKFSASLLFVGLLLCTGLPIMALALTLGGVGLTELLFAVLTTMLIVAAVSAMGLYFSATFRRSVHSTAVTYAAVIVLSVITLVAFLLIFSRWTTTHPGLPESQMPHYLRMPLYLNPYYFLTVSFGVAADISRGEWLICLAVYAGIAVAFVALTWRAIENSGEQL
ncbi:MAG TPA: ABC transporter permease subunit [Candidatus Angelobacter sp.]|nr:ABC transporter permease subunit [Candidatus Angelobacter sp.]